MNQDTTEDQCKPQITFSPSAVAKSSLSKLNYIFVAFLKLLSHVRPFCLVNHKSVFITYGLFVEIMVLDLPGEEGAWRSRSYLQDSVQRFHHLSRLARSLFTVQFPCKNS